MPSLMQSRCSSTSNKEEIGINSAQILFGWEDNLKAGIGDHKGILINPKPKLQTSDKNE